MLKFIACMCAAGAAALSAATPDALSVAALSGAARSEALSALVKNGVAEAALDDDARLRNAWAAFLLADAAQDDAAFVELLRAAVGIRTVKARMLFGAARDVDLPETRRQLGALTRAHEKTLPQKKNAQGKAVFEANPFDVPSFAETWEDPLGLQGRYAAGGDVVDVVAYPFNNYAAVVAPRGARVKLFGAPSPDGKTWAFAGEGVRGRWTRAGGFELTDAAGTRVLPRVTVGKTFYDKKPADAVVVLDASTGLANVTASGGKPPKWELHPDGTLELHRGARGSVFTRESLGDHRLYFEFRTAFNPESLGARRGNSGIYLMRTYELQICDSFGASPSEVSCGALYHICVPKVNACAPQLEWQSMEIEFKAPRFDADGKKIANARLSAWLNGELIHDDVEATNPTAASAESGRKLKDPQPPLPDFFQDHGNKVQYRNVYFIPRAAAE